MITRFRLPLFALAASLPVVAQAQSVNDFSLEPAPTPSASPRAQGPADTRSGVEIAPRAVNTPAPTPRPTVATPTPTPTASASLAPTQRSTATPVTVTPRPSASVQPRPTSAERATIESQPFPQVEAPSSDVQPNTATVAPQSTVSAAPSDAAPDDSDGLPWAWIAGALALLAGIGAAFIFRQRRKDAVVPEIERPIVASSGYPPVESMADALQLRIENEKLTRSAVYATLNYRLTLINRTGSALTDVKVGVDIIGASSRIPMDQQVATQATALETQHEIARIGPHQSLSLTGQVRLPLAGAQVVMQGRHPLLVPLMRVRVDGPGEGALVKTFVVGQGLPNGGKVQPFPLNDGPRSYAPIAQRELA